MTKIQMVHSNPEVFGSVREALAGNFEVVEATVPADDAAPDGLVDSDLYILDFELPDVLETLKAIRHHNEETETILLLPPKYQFKVVSGLFHYGINECLLKPFQPDDLIQVICKVKGLPLPGEKGAADSGANADDASYENAGDSGGDPSVEAVANYLLDASNLPMMPAIAMRIVRLCRDPDVNAEQIEKIVQSDQAFTAQLLKTANSALYRRSVPVRSIKQAVVRVGLRHVNNLAIGLSANSLHKKHTPRAQKLWQESRTVASAAQVVALPYKLHEDAFVAGLLHNVGKTLLNNLDSERFEECISLQVDGVHPLDAETDLFGVDHTYLGAALVKKWEIDPAFGEAIGFYPEPWSESGLSKIGKILSCSIHLAQVLMDLPVFTFIDEPLEPEERQIMEEEIMEHPAAIALKMKPEQLSQTISRLEKIFILDGADD